MRTETIVAVVGAGGDTLWQPEPERKQIVLAPHYWFEPNILNCCGFLVAVVSRAGPVHGSHSSTAPQLQYNNINILLEAKTTCRLHRTYSTQKTDSGDNRTNGRREEGGPCRPIWVIIGLLWGLSTVLRWDPAFPSSRIVLKLFV
jgi:hypothetical protein